MAKRKTSKKREFSFKDMKPIKLKSGVKLEYFDPKEYFRDSKHIFEALMECIRDGDAEAFKEILATYLDINNKEEFIRRSGIPRRTLYRMLTPAGNPTLDSIVRVVSALKMAG